MPTIDLPDHRELLDAPERAHLAMLRTAAALATHALVIEHGVDVYDCQPEALSDRPSFLIAALLLGRLDELALLLDWYEHTVEGLFSTKHASPLSTPSF